MKKYIIIISAIILLILAFDFAYFDLGWYIPTGKDEPSLIARAEGKEIFLKTENGFEAFEIKGVNLESVIPGKWTSDHAIDQKTYERWLSLIQDMGANTVCVNGVQSPAFYNALYEYNQTASVPLYLLQGIAVDDYLQFSYRDAFDKDLTDSFLESIKNTVDVIHGRKKLHIGSGTLSGSGNYLNDNSKYLLGYILGGDWEPSVVAYTNEKYADNKLSYQGEYLFSGENALPFEIMLSQIGDKLLEYETKKYGRQSLISFSSYPSIDPFSYPEDVAKNYPKFASLDQENILCTDKCVAGQFASYHVYPYDVGPIASLDDINLFCENRAEVFYNGEKINFYATYLSLINRHHTMPVVITEFGVSSARNSESVRVDSHGVYSRVNEKEQGIALKWCWEDIKNAGVSGGCLAFWQDDPTERSLGTMYAVNEQRTAYWSDHQTVDQHFGLLSFDSGEESSVCYVDGDPSEWSGDDIVTTSDEMTLSLKYDEEFVYILVEKKDLDLSNDAIYIPIDTTQKSGSNYCLGEDVRFAREADFLLVIKGKDGTRLLVQERYEALRSTYSQIAYGFDTYVKENVPERNSPEFVKINSLLKTDRLVSQSSEESAYILSETGKLLYGNSNPESESFNSLADFCSSDGYIEIRIPWQLLNFSDPSHMEIHDDYYDNYGVEYIKINKLYVGVGDKNERIPMAEFKLKGWSDDIKYHERLKDSYYIMQELWKEGK